MTHPGRLSADRSGFTLLELLVVVSVISVLMGLGVGYLSKSGGGLAEAQAAIGAQLRTAALTARTRGLPTEVRIEPGKVGGRGRVAARVQEPLLTLHFEPEEKTLNPGFAPQVFGLDEPKGRFGHGRKGLATQKEPLAMVPLPLPAADLRLGFALRMEVLLHERQQAVLARIGTYLELGLDGSGRPRASMVQRGDEGRGGAIVTLAAREPLPLLRWVTVELTHDGRSLTCLVDGAEVARADAGGRLMQGGEDRLDLSPGDAPLNGVLDEVQLFAFVEAEPLDLPAELEVEQPVIVAFGRDGEPIAPPPIALRVVRENRTETLRVKRGGVLE